MLFFIGDVQRTPFRGVDMYSRAHVYTCLHALCLHSVDSPVSVALGFSALAAVLFYLLCESYVFKVYVRFFFHYCYVIMFVHVRSPRGRLNINPLGTPVDTPTPRFHVGVPSN